MKIVPLWGLTLIGTTVLYFAPLVYIRNKEFIDAQVDHTANVIKQQSNQLREASAQSLTRASETARSYAGEYGTKAQNLIGTAKAKTAETYNQASTFAAEKTGQAKTQTAPSAVNSNDFPSAPKSEPVQVPSKPEAVPAEVAL